MVTIEHFRKNIFSKKNLKKILLSSLIVLFFNPSCTNKSKNVKNKTAETTKGNTITSPVSVIITNPITIRLDTCPLPQNIVIPSTSKNFRLKNGEVLKLTRPEEKAVEFFSIMQNYTTDNGLALDAVSCSFMDKNGNLWFGTNGGGVSEYDGKTFTNYSTSQGLPNNLILCITQDRVGNIWFGTQGGGASCYDGKNFKTFNSSNGLLNNVVWSIFEDNIGNIWFGSQGGKVTRYDGNRVDAIRRGDKIAQRTQKDLKKIKGQFVKTFTNYTTSREFEDDLVSSIIQDKTGKLWFGKQRSGISCYDGKSFKNFTTKQGLVNNIVTSIKKDKVGNLWIATFGGGVSHYDGKSFTNFTTKQGLANNNVWCITEDSKGNIWFGTETAGVSCYNGKNFTNFTTKQGLANNNVMSITEDKAGNLWFGTQGGGLSRYDGNVVTIFTTKQGLSDDVVWSILEDKIGNLWFGTNTGGLSQYDGKSFINFTTKQGLANMTIVSSIEDKTGRLWFGTYSNGVSRYDGKSFTNFTTSQGLIGNYIASIKEDRSGNLWFGSKDAGVSRYDGKSFTNFTTKQGLADNAVCCIAEDKIGNLWFGTFGGGVSRYDGNRVEVIEKKGKTAQQTLQNLKTVKGKLAKTFTNYTTEEGLANNIVFIIEEDKSGNLWFGTFGGGISRYDGKTFANFTTTHGLPDDIITQIISNDKQNLFLGTNKGLAVLTSFILKTSNTQNQHQKNKIPAQNDLSNEELKNYIPVFEIYNTTTGYPIKDVNAEQNSMYRDSKGIIWIATGSDKTGLIRFDYKAINRNKLLNRLFIKSLKINEEKISWYDLSLPDSNMNLSSRKKDNLITPENITEELATFGRILTVAERYKMRKKFNGIQFNNITPFYPLPENLVLPYKNNNLTFEFAAIEPAKSFLMRYQYMLEGYDDDWRPITEKTTATFGNIYEGTYTFKVKAQFTGLTVKGAEGWSEPILYRFKVLPPWWRTWWMICIDSFAIFTLLFGIYRWRTAAHRKDKEKLELTVIERTRELQKLAINLEDTNKELQKSSVELKESATELKATNKELEAFSYSVSHDLRSPLRAINGYSKILVEDYALKLDNDGIGFLNAIGNNSKKMGQLIDDLLAFSKLGRTKITTSKIDMDALVNIVKEEEMMENKNEITFTITEILPAMATQSLIKQVWINLISNAIKYSSYNPKPSIEIGSYFENNLVVYYVKDNGAGFDMQYYDKLFGVFQRLHSQEEFDGTGIGLAIVQKIINRHGGTVWAESKVNEGACFYFSLPIISS